MADSEGNLTSVIFFTDKLCYNTQYVKIIIKRGIKLTL